MSLGVCAICRIERCAREWRNLDLKTLDYEEQWRHCPEAVIPNSHFCAAHSVECPHPLTVEEMHELYGRKKVHIPGVVPTREEIREEVEAFREIVQNIKKLEAQKAKAA